jgi:hypothetical protein
VHVPPIQISCKNIIVHTNTSHLVLHMLEQDTHIRDKMLDQTTQFLLLL